MIAESRQEWRLGSIVLSAVVCIGGCGHGESAETRYKKAISLFATEISPEVKAWAAGAVAVYVSKIRESDGVLDSDAAEDAVAPQSKALGESICRRLKAKEKVLLGKEKDNHFNDTLNAVEKVLQTSFAQTAAREPRLMFGLGLSTWGLWPPFLLKDPQPQASEPVSTDSQSLASHIKPEFLGASGRLAIPDEGAPGYDEFEQWFFFTEGGHDIMRQQSGVAGYEADKVIHVCIYGVPPG